MSDCTLSLWVIQCPVADHDMGSLSWSGLQVKSDITWPLPETVHYHCSSTSCSSTNSRSRILRLVWCPVSLSGTCKVPAYVRDQNVVVKATCRHLLDLSTYIKQCECCPQQWDPAVHRSTLCPSINLACLGIPTGPSQKTAQTNTTQCSHMESCLSRWPVKTSYPHY